MIINMFSIIIDLPKLEKMDKTPLFFGLFLRLVFDVTRLQFKKNPENIIDEDAMIKDIPKKV